MATNKITWLLTMLLFSVNYFAFSPSVAEKTSTSVFWCAIVLFNIWNVIIPESKKTKTNE